jgi:hypothetical protein
MTAITVDILFLVELLDFFKITGSKIEIPIINPIENKCSNPKILNSSASNI